MKSDSDQYLRDQVLPTISDKKWAKILSVAGYVRRGDPTWNARSNSLECVVVRHDSSHETSLTIRGSYISAGDGEWFVIAESFGTEQASADQHGPFSFKPLDDAIKIGKAVVNVLRSAG